MKILVVSDTHERTAQLEDILRRHADEVQMVCHLGDHARDLLKYQTHYSQLNMVAVAGNCDYTYTEKERILAFNPCIDSKAEIVTRILLIHGHNHGVKMNYDRLTYYAKEKGVDACFFGHTHSPVVFERGGIYMFNPGSPSCPRGGSEASYGIVDVSPNGEITGRVIRYEKS